MDQDTLWFLLVTMEGKSPIAPLFKAKQAIVSVSHASTQGFTQWGGVVKRYAVHSDQLPATFASRPWCFCETLDVVLRVSIKPLRIREDLRPCSSATEKCWRSTSTRQKRSEPGEWTVSSIILHNRGPTMPCPALWVLFNLFVVISCLKKFRVYFPIKSCFKAKNENGVVVDDDVNHGWSVSMICWMSAAICWATLPWSSVPSKYTETSSATLAVNLYEVILAW